MNGFKLKDLKLKRLSANQAFKYYNPNQVKCTTEIPKQKYYFDTPEVINYYKHPFFSFALYTYDTKNKSNIYLSNVKVYEKFRGVGFGNKLLEYAYNEAKKLGFKYLFLKVKYKTPVYKWYKKHKFKFYSTVMFEENMVWMFKEIL